LAAITGITGWVNALIKYPGVGSVIASDRFSLLCRAAALKLTE
jgi:hypothetical protein